MTARSSRFLAFLLIVLLAGPLLAATPPRLLVVVVVDQLPRSYLERFGSHFSSGGFRRLIESGADYPNCFHQQLSTLTGPGHASLLTGAYPNHHGIIGNKWYSRERKVAMECTEDDLYQPLGEREEEVAPADKPGVSPRSLLVPTVGDVLRLETEMRAKVVSLAIKDRSAVLLGGWRPNGAYWYDTGTCRFITSSYYAESLPAWITRFNDSRPCDDYVGQSWEKLLPKLDYETISAADDLPYERPSLGLGVTFPHRIVELSPPTPESEASNSIRYGAVVASPFGNDLLLRLARAAVEGEGLGEDEIPDILTLGLSTNDYVGHMYGPQSQEVADLTLRTDRQLDEWMQYLDRKIGKGAWTLLLTSDHGIAPIPEHLEELGILSSRPDHYRLDVGVARSRIEEKLSQRFFAGNSHPADFAGFFEAWDDATFPFVYLNRDALPQLPGAPSFEDFQAIVAAAIAELDGVDRVYTRSERDALGGSADIFYQRAYRTWNDVRGGDLLVQLRTHWLPLSSRFATTHGSPYSYDSQVPMLLYGAGIRPGRYLREVEAVDAASTVADLLHVSQPPGDQGRPLAEALR